MTWVIAALALAAIVFRPLRVSEAVWACAGALALVLTGAISLADAGGALARGLDVYCFLIGMMALAAFAGAEGIFAWFAAGALRAARGSRRRLFAIVYAVGIVTTALLSNDATIVVLTPAVIATLAATDVEPLPYLYACAFIANAASFILPISNPSNLLVFAGHIPPLGTWLRFLALPSLAAIALTFGVLLLLFRGDLRGAMRVDDRDDLGRPRALALVTLAGAALALVVVSSAGGPLGFATLGVAAVAVAVAAARDRSEARKIAADVSWPIVPLTAALFVIVAAVDRAGALAATRTLITHGTPLVVGWILAIASNLANNLPVGLNAGETLAAVHPPLANAYAALIGVNLGPNISTNGSLATILWLAILRRANVAASPLAFLRIGVLATPLALTGALLALRA